MTNFFEELISSTIQRIEYSIVHMDSVQWAVVSVVAVAIGFLALRSKAIY